MKNFSRKLNDDELVEHFLENVLSLDEKLIEEYTPLIRNAEMKISDNKGRTTLHHKAYRNRKYREDNVRRKLHNDIFEELAGQERPNDDDEIKLGFGGALPKSSLKNEKQAYIIIGLPASGKSGIANKIADEYGCIILDSDFAKRKFPEFYDDFGANLVHEEASTIIFGGEKQFINYNLMEACIAKDINIVIPKIGNNANSILDLANYLNVKEYEVHLILVSLDRQKATLRALNRFVETKRYVPLSLVFDSYGNDSILSYYRIKNEKIFKSFSKLSSEVSRGCNPKIIECSVGSPISFFK